MMNSLICGGLAGVAVDIALFPLDTIKTRIQSRQGFIQSGGFKGLYTGLGPMAFASFPGAASFFVTYDYIKNSKLLVDHNNNSNSLSFTSVRNQVIAATGGELVACLIRVPSENVKQNLQALNYKTLKEALIGINKRERYGFYKGYFATILREIPFSIIQFPLWEGGKKLIANTRGEGGSCTPFESALCGSFAGGFAGAVTTPLDVIKTRLMTSPEKYSGILNTIRIINKEEGNATFLKGLKPRVTWISIGGFVFFGAYEELKKILKFLE